MRSLKIEEQHQLITIIFVTNNNNHIFYDVYKSELIRSFISIRCNKYYIIVRFKLHRIINMKKMTMM